MIMGIGAGNYNNLELGIDFSLHWNTGIDLDKFKK